MGRKSKAKEESQKDWEDKIARAKKVRKAWKDLFSVDLAKEYFDGKQRPPEYPTEEWVTINKIYSHLKAQLPALYSADPYFYVRLRRSFSPNRAVIEAWELKGKIRQAYLNYLKDECRLKEKVRLAIQDAHFSYGVVKCCYRADIEKNPDYGKVITADDETTVLFGDEGTPLEEPQYIPVNERYEILRVHPDDFLWDEDSGPLEENWTWLAQRIREPWAKAEKNPWYNKSVLKSIKQMGDRYWEEGDEERDRENRKKGGDIKGPSEQRKNKRGTTSKDPQFLVAWEIYDLEKKKKTVIAEGGDAPLIDEDDLPPGVEKHPFALLRFTLRDDSPYPHPPLSPLVHLNKEYNIARSSILKHRKRFNRKYEVLHQALATDNELSKLESGDDGACILVQATGAINPIQDAPLDQMRYQELGYLNGEMIEVGGGSHDEARGIAGADSATQAGILDKRLEMKEGDAMSMVIDFVRDIARKLDQLVQANITGEEAVKVTGPEGEYWEMVREDSWEEIEGEFEYSVNVGATIPRMPQMERASWQAFLQLLQGFPHLLTQRHLLKRMAEMHHIEVEAMLAEMMELGKQILGGQVPMPGPAGSQPGVGEDRPMSAVGGMAGGVQSLNQPMAGNAPGGGQ
jgi:hypothetical protein